MPDPRKVNDVNEAPDPAPIYHCGDRLLEVRRAVRRVSTRGVRCAGGSRREPRSWRGGWTCPSAGPQPCSMPASRSDCSRKTDDTYRNTPAGDRYLTSRSPESLRVTLDLQADTYPMWIDLSEAVRNGQPVIAPETCWAGTRS